MYTEREIIERIAVTRPRLSQLRRGRQCRRYRESEERIVYEWSEDPKLERGRHWDWQDGRVMYTEEGAGWLMEQYGERLNR